MKTKKFVPKFGVTSNKVSIVLAIVALSAGAKASTSNLTCDPSNNQDLVTVGSNGSDSGEICNHQQEIYKAYVSAFADVSSRKMTVASFVAFDTTLGILQLCYSNLDYCELRQSNLEKLLREQNDQMSKALISAQKAAVIQLCGD